MSPTPRSLFRTVAVAEAVTWTLLLAGMFLKYVTQTTELGVRVGGMLHGVVFLAFVVTTVVVWIDQRWSARAGVLALASAIPPWTTLLFERWAERRGAPEVALGDRWRLAGPQPDDQPASTAERVLAAGLRRPGRAVVVAVVGIAAVTAVLLIVGPPTPPG